MPSGEDDLIARYFRTIATDPAALGLIDDAAALPTNGDDLIVTADAIVEGVHFLSNDPPDSIARKALRVNLSDLAAKGAEPAGFVLTLALRSADPAWLEPFAHALGDEAKAFGCPLLGGDTVSTPGPVMASVTAFGRTPRGAVVRRSGAQPGDRVIVTGTIGDAALGLEARRGGLPALSEAERAALIGRYRIPQPRNALARALRNAAHAAMDVSDGLVGDLAKLCAASGVAAEIDAACVPLSDAARRTVAAGEATLERLVSGGDDYEILAAMPDAAWPGFAAAAAAAGIAVAAIGRIIAGEGVRVLGADGRPMALSRTAYSHF